MAAISPTSAPKRYRAKAAASPLSWRLIRAAGRPPEVIAFEETVVAFFLEAAEILGAPKSLAAIYAICFASAEPLTFSEVRERLDISAGSISQGLRILRDVGALKIVATEIDRREFFTPDLELRKLAAHYINERLQKQINSGRIRLQAIGKAIPPSQNGSTVILRHRLKALQAWHDKTRAVLPLVKTFLKLT